ncbi:MAG: helix-turn-helix transcriptional regulator [Enhygromyxa sp.]
MGSRGPTALQLAGHLQRLREAAGLSIERLAERGEIALERVVLLESGAIDPSLDDLERYALGLGMPLSIVFRKWEHRLN